MVLFDEDPGVLNGWYVQMDEFLKSKLRLHLHPHKKHVNRAESGIDFTGFIIKPGRTYLRQSSLSGCKRKIRAWERQGSPVDAETLERVSQSLNSYLGSLQHGGGTNRTDRPHTGIVHRYFLGWLRQAEPQYLAVFREIARTLPERLQRLLGYFVHEPNLGSLEGQDPVKPLSGELTINGHFASSCPKRSGRCWRNTGRGRKQRE